MIKEENRLSFIQGFKAAFPLFIGYFTVSFSIGITASQNGVNWIQAWLMSFLNHTSAGQAAAILMIGQEESYVAVGLSQLIFNLRYLLMSTALSLKLKEDTKLSERFIMSYMVTDEIFGLTIMRQGKLNAWFAIGAMCMAGPGWDLGTLLGAVVGNILPSSFVVALSVVLYSMFIAVIFPPAKKNKFMLIVIFVSMALSGLVSITPVLKEISFGTKAILLTIFISLFFAYIRPVEEV